MSDVDRELWERIIQAERERMLAQPPAPPRPIEPPPKIHYTELLPYAFDGPLTREWDFYRREVGRLLAEGHEGKWVLIKGEEIIGIWESGQAAAMAALERRPLQPLLIHQVLTWEPVMRMPTFFYRHRCLN